jgi:hypothetical protein
MSSPRSSSFRLRNVLAKVSIIAILLTASIQVIASCQDLKNQGFEMYSLCGANFDSQGNYINSTCRLGDPPEPGHNGATACQNSAEGCTGTTCQWDPPLWD